jgi:acetolactate synthase-1/2/3 large subunit
MVLAVAHRRVLGTRAVVHLGDGLLVEPDAPDASTGRISVDGDLAAAALAAFGPGGGGRLALAGDLEADVGDPGPMWVAPGGDRWSEPDDAAVVALDAAQAPVVLAGPGVLSENEVAGLHGLAAAGSLGVLNTWGAKGIFHWRSRHHLATGGLQARDFELGGLGDADLIVATGLDPWEAPDERWRLNAAIEVPPAALAPLAERWARPVRAIPLPPLRTGLAAATQAGWARTTAPLAPSQATRNYGAVLGRSGLLAADPGVAGFWAARTFSTTEAGAVLVPSRVEADGLAVAAAFVARRSRPSRPVLAVVDHLSELSREVLEMAASAGVAVPVEVWDGDGPALDGDAHLRRSELLVAGAPAHPVSLRVADDQLQAMVAVAGPVVAWGGIRGGD